MDFIISLTMQSHFNFGHHPSSGVVVDLLLQIRFKALHVFITACCYNASPYKHCVQLLHTQCLCLWLNLAFVLLTHVNKKKRTCHGASFYYKI